MSGSSKEGRHPCNGGMGEEVAVFCVYIPCHAFSFLPPFTCRETSCPVMNLRNATVSVSVLGVYLHCNASVVLIIWCLHIEWYREDSTLKPSIPEALSRQCTNITFKVFLKIRKSHEQNWTGVVK